MNQLKIGEIDHIVLPEIHIYRALLNKSWIQPDGSISHLALLRIIKDTDGISLSRGDRATPEEVLGKFSSAAGVAESTVSQVHAIQRDAQKPPYIVCCQIAEKLNRSDHAIINGLSASQNRQEPTQEQMDDATELADEFQLVLRATPTPKTSKSK